MAPGRQGRYIERLETRCKASGDPLLSTPRPPESPSLRGRRFRPPGAGRPFLIASAAFVALWFVYFAWSGLFARFSDDDMMNLYQYWRPGPWRALASQVMLGTNVYRPLGALFYLPLFNAFGLNPLPFRAVILVTLGANLWLTWRLAVRLGAGSLVAALACLLVAYHGNLADLHYSTASAYDVFCYTFYLAVLLYYSGAPIQGARRWTGLLALYLCALNAKEMAVTLPVMLLVYDSLYRRRPQWRPLAAAGLMTAVYCAGKMFGADPLMALEAYHPVLTTARFMESSILHANDIFYAGRWFDAPRLLGLWAAITYLAWRRPRPELRFAWAMILIAPLPIVFLPGRTHGCLYLPLAAWALLLATLAVDLAGGAAAFLRREPLVGRLGRDAIFWIVLAFGVVELARLTAAQKRRKADIVANNGALTAAVIEQFRAAHPKVAPNSWVLLVDDPFEAWDAIFIASLYWRDRSVTVWLQNKVPLREDEIRNRIQYVFRFEHGRLAQVKP